MDDIQKYLNQVGWATITILSEKFDVPRHTVTSILAYMSAYQDVRVYDGEIVHVN